MDVYVIFDEGNQIWLLMHSSLSYPTRNDRYFQKVFFQQLCAIRKTADNYPKESFTVVSWAFQL